MPSFERFTTHQLRSRYLELEGDFRTVVGHHPPTEPFTAQAIFDLLQTARKALEEQHPVAFEARAALDLVDQYMVWLCPEGFITARAISTRARLEALRPSGWEGYYADLDPAVGPPALMALRPCLDEAIGVCNRQSLDDSISRGLQIRRLGLYAAWGLGILLMLLFISPTLANAKATAGWPIDHFPPVRFTWLKLPYVVYFRLLANAGLIAALGAVGGFVSGLLQATSSRVGLTDYQVTMWKLFLRPMLGAIVALILVVFLSWNIIPSVSTANPGAIMLAAFLCGFSERYFLGLVDPAKGPAPRAATAAALTVPPAPPGAGGAGASIP